MMILAQAVAGAEAATVQLTLGGAVVMFLSIILVTGLNVFCMYRVLRGNNAANQADAGAD